MKTLFNPPLFLIEVPVFVFVCYGYTNCLVLRICYWIL